VNLSSTRIGVTLQLAVDEAEGVPSEDEFSGWIDQALQLSNAESTAAACVTIRIVSGAESSELNGRYRYIERPTNVLAFPSGEIPVPLEEEMPGELAESMAKEAESELGDLVMCLDVVTTEADEQNKSLKAHFAHLAVHGALHLVGYNHLDYVEAGEMEALETRILETLGFDDPYRDDVQPD
jgi:probable rRNA maturation factor